MSEKNKLIKKRDVIKEFYLKLGNTLRDVRTSLGLSAYDVAKKLNITGRVIKDFESAKIRIHVYYLEKLLDIYNVEIRDLIPSSFAKKEEKPEEIDYKKLAYHYKALAIRLNDNLKKQVKFSQSLNNNYSEFVKILNSSINNHEEINFISEEIKEETENLVKKESQVIIASNDEIVSLSVIDNDKVNKNSKKSKDEKSELKAKEKFVLSISENGYGKKTSHIDYRVTNRGGKGIIGIINSPRNGNITSSFPVFEGDEILISTNKGRVIRVAVKEIRTASRNTQGVRIIKLSGDEKVVSAIKIDDNLI